MYVVRGKPIVGGLREYRTDSLSYFLNSALEAGPDADMLRFRIGFTTFYMPIAPPLIREILVSRANLFDKSKIDLRVLQPSLGNGLLTSNGNYHRRQRRLIQPAFHPDRLGAYAAVMKDFAADHIQDWRDGQEKNIAHEMMRLTMFIVARALFHADVRSVAEEIGTAIQDLQEAADIDLQRGFPLPHWLPTPNNRRRKRSRSILRNRLTPIIEQHRQGEQSDAHDLLSMLLSARDDDGSRLTPGEVYDQTVTLFAAGHETTSNALTWCWYLLSQHPHVEAQLHSELESRRMPKESTATGGLSRIVSDADFARLPFTQQIVKETLRLYPPAWMLMGRELNTDARVGDYQFKRGTVFFISPYVMHRLPQFFENPTEFNPDRFTPENESGINRFAYIPFGAGPHVCIGNYFAQLEATLLLASIARHFRLELHPDQAVRPRARITLSNEGGMRMILRAR